MNCSEGRGIELSRNECDNHTRFHMFWCILASDHDGSEEGGES